MRFQILFLMALYTLAKQEEMDWPDRAMQEIYFNGKYYEFEILKDGVNNLRQMLYDTDHDRLYYIYFLYNSNPTTRAAYIDIINNNIVQIIAEIKNPRMIAKDYINDYIYMGTKDGIYRLYNNGNSTKLNVNDNIVGLHVKDAIYYVNVRKEAFLYVDGDIDKVFELITYDVDSLIVDSYDNIFFLSDRRLHKTKMNRKKKTVVVAFERHIVGSMSIDVNGQVYVCAMDGIFVYDRRTKGLKKVSELRNVQALTFDTQNMPILSYADKIIKLNEKSTRVLMVEYGTL